jgi:hypothetical protein
MVVLTHYPIKLCAGVCYGSGCSTSAVVTHAILAILFLLLHGSIRKVTYLGFSLQGCPLRLVAKAVVLER